MRKIIVTVLVVFCVIYLLTAPIVSGFLNLQKEVVRDDVFVELWHIDTFEGGKNSRGEFLKKVAVALNKKNKNEFVVIKTITEMELIERLKSGQLPEMFSFGTGLGALLQEYLVENNVGTGQRDWLDECVKVDGKILATPYAFGGYFKIGNSKHINYAVGTVLSPMLALYFDNDFETIKGFERIEGQTTVEAYQSFIERGGTLLGTQRDVVRVSNRVDGGKMNNVDIKAMPSFVDMIMSIGITGIEDERKRVACERFTEYLLCETVQSQLSDLRLFPAREKEIYTIPFFSDYEKQLEKVRCINVFTPNEILKKNNELAKKAIDGDLESRKFIENYFK